MELSDAVFKDLRAFIYERTGIFFHDNKKYLLQSRLHPRLRERSCTSFEEYYRFLKYDAWRDKELAALYALITTNETFFYRDLPQLDAFLKHVVPVVMDTNKTTAKLSIWSAACSSGDEPYTLAMMLMEHPPLAKWTIEILATDISETVLTQARKAVYGPYAVRNIPPALLKKYFTEDNGLYTLSHKVKERVRFAPVNLFDRSRLKQIRHIDVLFCRNCLIYFDDKARQQILNDFYDCLKPSGQLIIGFSESLHNVSRSFRPVHAGRSVVYQKL